MKLVISLNLILILSLSLSLIVSLNAESQTLPHMDLQMSGFEYESILNQRIHSFELKNKTHIFDDIFASGKRNLDWIRLLNKNRSEHISLSTFATQEAFPFEKPRIYNNEIIRAAYNDLKWRMPESLRKVIFGTELLPTQLPCPTQEYIKWGLAMDRVYQIAARWKIYEPKIDDLIANSSIDIRGYHFLTSIPGLLNRLKDWQKISLSEHSKIILWLNQVCRNDLDDIPKCKTLTAKAIQNNKVFSFFNEHRKAGERIMHRKMSIPTGGRFKVIDWISEQAIAVPFTIINDPEMQAFLTDNIQAEWQLFPFSVKLNFVSEGQFGVNVIWRPGIIPNVPGLGSSTIYMDANSSISEFDTQQAIRHEFGHVLGFPDCYIEFYDLELKAIVGYQLDTTDLMCSRQGHITDRHIQEIIRSYHVEQ